MAAAAARGSLKRDVQVMGLVGGAHFVSHFFQLALPPLFPLLRTEFDVTYVQLGLLMSLFYASSGIGQTASGFLVDHWGARRVLPSGMALFAFAMALAGFCLGATSPSRDMLVRAATPPGASGKVYGFVYSGLDLGSSLTPLLFGWLLDRRRAARRVQMRGGARRAAREA